MSAIMKRSEALKVLLDSYVSTTGRDASISVKCLVEEMIQSLEWQERREDMLKPHISLFVTKPPTLTMTDEDLEIARLYRTICTDHPERKRDAINILYDRHSLGEYKQLLQDILREERGE